MSDQPEALRLAEILETSWRPGGFCSAAAAELRRLHKAETDFHMDYRMKCDAELKKLQAERDALKDHVHRLESLCHDMAGELTVLRAIKQMQAAIDAARSKP